MSLPKTITDLHIQGWEKQKDGSYAKTKTNRPPVDQLPHPQLERREIQTLESGAQKQAGRADGVHRVRVQIISLRKRLIDDDNLSGGAKSLRDGIALRLGIDDGDPRIRFEYCQIKTQENLGTHILIYSVVQK